ncbi:MAG: nucleotide exchange factor GrpE [Steroidobacteraceae bacterium]
MSESGAGQGSPDFEQPLEADNTGVTEVEQLQRELAEAQVQVSQHRDQLLRAAAELDNIRKRSARDVEHAHRYALEKFAQELLPVRDSLELAAASASNADASILAAGQEATLKLLARAFEKFAINGFEPVGEPFDPQRHEAMAVQEAPAAEPDSVLQVVQRGYELNGRLLRPARVIVAKSPGGA